MSDGTKQQERTPAALAPERIRLDELDFAERAAMMAGLGAALHYVGLDNQPSGDWSGLFTAADSFVFASILCDSGHAARTRLLEDFAAVPVARLVRVIGGEARRFDGWLDELERINTPAAAVVGEAMQAMVKNHLQRELASIWPRYYALAPHPRRLMAAYANMARIEPAVDTAGDIDNGGRVLPPATEVNSERLRSQLASMASAIERLQEVVRAELPHSLESGQHDPAAGMLLAFLGLYDKVQAHINTFTRRHTDFYYRDCLYALPRPARPDHVHLVFRRDANPARQVQVRRGSVFSAGKDAAGREICFRTDSDLAIGTARVAALCSLRFERDAHVSPEHELHYATRAIATRLPASATVGETPMQSWPLLGGPAEGGERARIGLAVASRQLFLKEGKRRVVLGLRIEDRLESDAGVGDAIRAHAVAAKKVIDLLRPGIETLLRCAVRQTKKNVKLAAAKASERALAGLLESLIPLLAASPQPAGDAAMRRLLQADAWALWEEYGEYDGERSAEFTRTMIEQEVGRCLADLHASRDELLRGLADTVAPLRALYSRYAQSDPALLAAHADDAGRLLDEMAASHAVHCAAFTALDGDAYLHHFLAALTAAAPHRKAFHILFGTFFRHWLLAARNRLRGAELSALRQRYEQLFPHAQMPKPGLDEGDPLCFIYRKERIDKSVIWLEPNRDLMFDRLIGRIFSVTLSTAQGWFTVADAHAVREMVTPSSRCQPDGAGCGKSEGTGSAGFSLDITLHPHDPAVVACLPAVHGEQWNTDLPILQLELNADARVYGYDLLGASLLTAVEVAVEVKDVRGLALGNQLGRIDPAKPFNPFGPLPDLASYLVMGSPEIARKNLTACTLRVRWAGLPSGENGFATHYDGYETPLDNQAFAVSVSLLRDGQWQRLGKGGMRLPLFASAEGASSLLPQAKLRANEADLDGQFHHEDQVRPEGQYAYDLTARNGFLKFQLVSPAGAFGHAAYPQLLSRVITANVRRKQPLPLPNPPYTPLIEGITLDYRAASRLRPGIADCAGGTGGEAHAEKIFHLYPFGVREIHPAAVSESPGVLPRFVRDGNLYIAIEGGEPGESVSLLFHLQDEAAREAAQDHAPLVWRYLSGDEWVRLPPDRLLGDSTDGFLTSGIVQLILPEDINRQHCILAAGVFWLCISTDGNAARFAGLHGVHAQAQAATRVLDANGAAEFSGLPSGSVKSMQESVPGLAGVVQIGTSFGMRVPENERRLYTRMGERLRHKNRAVTAWDIERLVLEEFPQVFKVKCLPGFVSPLSTRGGWLSNQTGQVLVAVLPMVPHGVAGMPLPRLNTVELDRIRDYLTEKTSSHAHIAVRNAAYERIQVRCTAELTPHSQSGLSLQFIHTELDRYLSPWQHDGYQAGFDWTIRCKDVETFLRGLSCVRAVGGLSLLRISEDDFGDYRLADTARGNTDAAYGRASATKGKVGGTVTAGGPQVRASWPWSIAAPMDWHLIEIAASANDPRLRRPPRATGIGHLTVGGNYIVGSTGGESDD